MSNFGNRLKELRLRDGYTQDELANKLSISRSSESAYERNLREPNFETLELIADFFNVDMNYLLGKTEVKRKHDYTIETIAAHHDGDVWTEEELKAIEDFKAFVKSKRNK